jgi:hypothetical protein
VDEDLDGLLSWNDFRLMYVRNVSDKTGLEFNRIYTLAQFLIYDVNYDGLVSLDETMHMLYVRYGKGQLESKLKDIFGQQPRSVADGGDISFSVYGAAMDQVPNLA